MGFERRPFGRKEKSKAQLKKEALQRQHEYETSLRDGFYHFSSLDVPLKSIDVYQSGLSEFFLPVSFSTNKIHIIRGNNGQGKSTLLKEIVKATSYNKINNHSDKLKFGSNNFKMAQYFNYWEERSEFKYEDNLTSEWFGKHYINTNSNTTNNLTFYIDFTIDFFRNQINIFNEAVEAMDSMSNGERKIRGINGLLYFLKLIKSLDVSKIDKSINLIVCMDEPESGLSVELQEEFYNRIKYYLKSITKMSDKITLTFFIVSHSFIWKKEPFIDVHNVNSFKVENSKKEHQKVFL